MNRAARRAARKGAPNPNPVPVYEDGSPVIHDPVGYPYTLTQAREIRRARRHMARLGRVHLSYWPSRKKNARFSFAGG